MRSGGASGEAITSTGASEALATIAESDGQPGGRVEDDAKRLAGCGRIEVARGEQRVVGERGADPDRDGVGFGAPAVDERPALGPRDPLRVAGRGGGAPVEGERRLERHQRARRPRVLSEGLDEKARRGGFGALCELDLDARVAEDPGPAPASLLGGIVGEIDDARDARLDERVGARRLAALVGARLERHVRGRAGRVVAAFGAVLERGALSVEAAELRVPALADGLAVPGDDASDHGVGRDETAPAFGHLERSGEVRTVVLRDRGSHVERNGTCRID